MRPMRALCLLVPLAVAGCMNDPENGDAVCASSAPTTLAGYTLAANQTVVIESASAPAGPFTPFATAKSSWQGTLTGGYRWATGAVIPGWSGGRTGQTVHVRARLETGGRIPILLYTYDNAVEGGGQSGFACILEALANGENALFAAFDCRSPESPVVTLSAPGASTCECPTSFTGSAVVNDAESAARFACLESLDGDLLVARSYLTAVSIPSLHTVTGDVTLDYTPDPAYQPQTAPSRTIALPALATIGGDLLLRATAPALGAGYPLGLAAVTSIGGGVRLDFDGVVNFNVQGLAGVTSVPGDVVVEGGGDLFPSGFLPNLVAVGGDLEVETNHSLGAMFGSLETVAGDYTVRSDDGDVIILGAFQGPLAGVGGTLRLEGCSTNVSGLWPALASVGGSLELIENAPPALSDLGSASLVVGGLVVDATAIQQMDAAHVSVSGAGPIAITDNPQLDTCDAETFVATQQAGGWSGTATIAGNGGASCP
jgi:hypothetical protein